MKSLAHWAKSMPWTARFIIVLSHVIFIWLGIFIGKELALFEFHIPISVTYVLALIFIIAAFTYPEKRNRKTDPGHFIKQKSRDFLLAACTFGMVVSLSNSPGNFLSTSLAANATVMDPLISSKEKPTAEEILASLKYRDKKSLTRVEKKVLRQEFKKQLKIYVVATVKGDKKAQASAGLIILSIVVALGLLLLVGAIACDLSCNGNDGAAIIVGLLGTAAVVLGLIFVIKAINKKKNKPKEEPPPGT